MLVRHIAGIPTATEQRCVRCCEVVAKKPNSCWWPGATAYSGLGSRPMDVEDCKPVDLNETRLLGVDRVPVELL